MAHIKKLIDKPRNKPWRGAIHRKGLRKQLVKFFRTRKEVELWAREQESSLDRTGPPLTIEDLKKVTVGDIVRRYLAEITPTKGCAVSEGTVLNKFLQRDICYKSLAFVSKTDAYKYINQRLKETWRGKPITPRTIRREVNSIQHIAMEEKGSECLLRFCLISILAEERFQTVFPGLVRCFLF